MEYLAAIGFSDWCNVVDVGRYTVLGVVVVMYDVFTSGENFTRLLEGW